MLEPKRIATAVGLLAGVALIGVGAVRTVGAEDSGDCAGSGGSGVRCERVREYRLPADLQGEVRFTGRQEQDCSGSDVEVSCVNGTLLGGERV
ncbi:hypothetical protein [Streptomyces prasinopilosus]|uniref:Uncharacterized protein n=1 Tax=Streptomyces prasinopilosus TaxID=67344 RepID=A0A1G6IL36_9ACTN|nr:hypothetical protein [Streptomyces prasinopilosus]SDC07163.1 hypothetical protein SAMN05216505_101297 [Streptomyces prasinopilosus]